MRHFIVLLLIPLALSAQTVPAGRGSPQGRLGQAPPPTPVEDLATVEGPVFNALGGSALRKANIVMTRVSSVPVAAGPRSNYSATADGSGRFAITGIEPGKYRVSATHIGFLGIEYNARRPGAIGTPIELARAQKTTGVDFHLTPQGVISGKVTDEDGDPLQNVNIRLLHVVYTQGQKQLQQLSNTGTDDLGEYRIPGILPGKYYLCAIYRNMGMAEGPGMAVGPASSAPNGSQEDYVPTYFPGGRDASSASPIDVGPGEQAQGVNLRLTKIHTVAIRGRAVDNAQPASGGGTYYSAGAVTYAGANGPVVTQIANAVRQIYLQPRGPFSSSAGTVTTAPRADGSFEFLSVAPGAYYLVAVANPGNMAHVVRQAIDVSSANLEGVTLAINPGAPVTGHVRVDGDGPLPAVNLSVRLTPRNDVPGLPAPPAAKVDAGGNFRFEDVNPELYSVTINTPQNYYLKSVRAGNTDALAAGLDLASGAGSLDILLGANPPQVGGSVLNAALQQPAPAVTVVLIPQEKERQGQSFFYVTTTTDQYGNFSFTRGVMEGEYKVCAWEDVTAGAWYDPEFMKQFDGKGESVAAREGTPANLKLTMIPAK